MALPPANDRRLALVGRRARSLEPSPAPGAEEGRVVAASPAVEEEERVVEWTIAQADQMGRPSTLLRGKATWRGGGGGGGGGGDASELWIGGPCARVAIGHFVPEFLP